jgi:putative flavoprotein involved in K+ transport
MSHCLSARGDGQVVLERGRVAGRWRSERLDTMRLFTPNWMGRLRGWS